MQKIYLISGLGADRRFFYNLRLPGYEPVYIDWLEPDMADTLHTYAQKLINKYEISAGAIVIGVSLGGMLTVKISSLVRLKYTIIISSIRSVGEFPWYYSLFKALPIYKTLPVHSLPIVRPVINQLFGLRSKEESDLFINMIEDISPKFFNWAIHAVLHWQPPVSLSPVYQIHGNKDVIFSSRRAAKDSVIINGGGHNMIFNKADEVSNGLLNIMNNETA